MSTGDVFRDAVKRRTPLGLEAQGPEGATRFRSLHFGAFFGCGKANYIIF